MAKSKTLLGFGVNDVDFTVRWKMSCGKDFSLPEYTAWKGMIVRCYGKQNIKKASYINTEVYSGWKSLKAFKDWFDLQVYESGFILDKDLLGNGNLYSPETCCFLPEEINGFLIRKHNTRGYHKRDNRYEACITHGREYRYLGTFKTSEEAFDVYRKAKEDYAKVLADKWKDKIDPRAYEALMNYQV